MSPYFVFLLTVGLMASHVTWAARDSKLSTLLKDNTEDLGEFLETISNILEQGGVDTSEKLFRMIEFWLDHDPSARKMDYTKKYQLLQGLEYLKKPAVSKVLTTFLRRLPEIAEMVDDIREHLISPRAQPIWDAIDPIKDPMVQGAREAVNSLLEVGARYGQTILDETDALERRFKDHKTQKSVETFMALPEVLLFQKLFEECGVSADELLGFSVSRRNVRTTVETIQEILNNRESYSFF